MADETSLQGVAQRLEELAQGFQRRFDPMDARFDRVDERLDRVEVRLDRVEVRLDGIDTRLDGIDTRLDGIDARLDRQALRLDSIDEKARLALEAHDALRESMDREFRAASEKADERYELLKGVAGRTSLRVEHLEARRKRR